MIKNRSKTPNDFIQFTVSGKVGLNNFTMMKSYLILLLFFGTIDMMFAQNDKGMNLDVEISNLNTNMLNDMLRRFAEENRSETKYYPNFFQISGETIKKSETNTEWRYGVWSISKVENRELIPPKASVNDYDSLLVMSAYDSNKTDGVQFSIWFTPKKTKVRYCN